MCEEASSWRTIRNAQRLMCLPWRPFGKERWWDFWRLSQRTFQFWKFQLCPSQPLRSPGKMAGLAIWWGGKGVWGQGGWKTHLGLSPGVRQVLCHRPPPPPPQPPGCCYSKWLFLKSPDLSQILSRLLKNLRRAAQAKQSPRQEEFHKKRRKFKGEI